MEASEDQPTATPEVPMYEPATIRCQRCDALVAILDVSRCESFCVLSQPAQVLCAICARHHTACGCWVEGPLMLVWGDTGTGRPPA